MSATDALGLPDALLGAPRPAGDPGAVLACARAWGGAAAALDRAGAGLVGTVATAAGTWYGAAEQAWELRAAEALTRTGSAAQGLDGAAAALVRFAAVLRAAQDDWDAARRAADADAERQLDERARTLAGARAAAAEHAVALERAHRDGTPPPDPLQRVTWSPDPRTPARRGALEAAWEARQRVEAAARAAAEALHEARATAWRAGAAGPVLRHGDPLFAALHARSPGAWRSDVGGTGLRWLCVAGAGYAGGGAVTGPDGRDYPLVVPYVTDRDGVRWTGDVSKDGPLVDDLEGRDTGWRTLWTADGVDLVGGSAGFGLRLAAALAGSAGWAPPATPRADAIPLLRLSATGHPSLSRGPAPQPPQQPQNALEPRRAAPVRVVRDGAGRQLAVPAGPLDAPVRSTGKGRVALRAAGAVDLATLGLTSAAAVRLVQDARARWYVVRYQENADGRTRALVRSYRVEQRATGLVVHVASVHLDPEGRVVEEPVRFRPAPGAVMRPSDVDYAVAQPEPAR